MFDKVRIEAQKREETREAARKRRAARSTGSGTNPIVGPPTEAVLRTRSGRTVAPPKPIYTPSSTGFPSADSESIGSESTIMSSESDGTYEPSFIDDRTQYTESTWSSVSRPRSDSLTTFSDKSSISASRASLKNAMGPSRETKLQDERSALEKDLKNWQQRRTKRQDRENILKARLLCYEGIADLLFGLQLDANVKAVDVLKEMRESDREALTADENIQYNGLEKVLLLIHKEQEEIEEINKMITGIYEDLETLIGKLKSLDEPLTVDQRRIKRAAPDDFDADADEPPAKRTAFETMRDLSWAALPLVTTVAAWGLRRALPQVNLLL